MKIGTTVLSSLRAQREFSIVTRALARSVAKLASGSRINGAQDDSVGLAMRNRLESQKNGFDAVQKSIGLAQGYVDTYQDALLNLSSIVTRMKEIALQASNGTISDIERADLNLQFADLLSDYQRIVTYTNFNGENILDGNIQSKKIQMGSGSRPDNLFFSLESVKPADVFKKYTGSGTYQTILSSRAESSQVFGTGDLNNDGFVDLVDVDDHGDGSADIYYYLGRGDGTFALRVTAGSLGAGSVTSATYAKLFDIDNDGNQDLFASYDDIISVQLGDGAGSFSTIRTYATASTGLAQEMSFGDFNTDGVTDMIVAEETPGTAALFIGNGNGTFQSRTTLTFTGVQPSAVKVLDFNGDSRPDLLIGGEGTVSGIYFGNGNGTFAVSQTFTLEAPYVDLGDINNDGILDFIGADNSPEITSVYFGNGNGTFALASTFSNTGSERGHKLADMNGDGNLDVIIASSATSVTRVYHGNGNGTFRLANTFLMNSAIEVKVFDINDDGANDIVQLGGGSGDTAQVALGIPQLRSALSDLNIETQDAAENILDILDNAQDALNSASAKAAAYRSRFEFIESNAASQKEIISRAASEISDLDFAEEVAELTRLQMIQSVTTTALAQSNLQMALVLNLLKSRP